MIFKFISWCAGDAFAAKGNECGRVKSEIDAANARKRFVADLVIETIEKHYGSGKAMQVADILRED